MTATEIRDALRRRHPATQHIGNQLIHGAWTTLEEYRGIDLLAISAHASPGSGKVRGVRYPRVGYEVKVSRSDYRRELLRPHKRAAQVMWCNAFYFAVPKGLLSDAELGFQEPHWLPEDFMRVGCPRFDCSRGMVMEPLIGPLPEHRFRYSVKVTHDLCRGRGYLEKSRVEQETPTLWVPRDVGLIEINGRGCHVTRESPVRKDVPCIGAGFPLADLVRWVSVRPDPRHVELAAGTPEDARRAA